MKGFRSTTHNPCATLSTEDLVRRPMPTPFVAHDDCDRSVADKKAISPSLPVNKKEGGYSEDQI